MQNQLLAALAIICLLVPVMPLAEAAPVNNEFQVSTAELAFGKPSFPVGPTDGLMEVPYHNELDGTIEWIDESAGATFAVDDVWSLHIGGDGDFDNVHIDTAGSIILTPTESYAADDALEFAKLSFAAQAQTFDEYAYQTSGELLVFTMTNWHDETDEKVQIQLNPAGDMRVLFEHYSAGSVAMVIEYGMYYLLPHRNTLLDDHQLYVNFDGNLGGVFLDGASNLPTATMPLKDARGEVAAQVPFIMIEDSFIGMFGGLDLDPGRYTIYEAVIRVTALHWNSLVFEAEEDEDVEISREDLLERLDREDGYVNLGFQPVECLGCLTMPIDCKACLFIDSMDCIDRCIGDIEACKQPCLKRDYDPCMEVRNAKQIGDGIELELPEDYYGELMIGTVVAQDQFGRVCAPVFLEVNPVDDGLRVNRKIVQVAEDRTIDLYADDLVIDVDNRYGSPQDFNFASVRSPWAFWVTEGDEEYPAPLVEFTPEADMFNANTDCDLIDELHYEEFDFFNLETEERESLEIPMIICAVPDGTLSADELEWQVNDEAFTGATVAMDDEISIEGEFSGVNEFEFAAKVGVAEYVPPIEPTPCTPTEGVTCPPTVNFLPSSCEIAAMDWYNIGEPFHAGQLGDITLMPVVLDSSGEVQCFEELAKDFKIVASEPKLFVSVREAVQIDEEIWLDFYVTGGSGNPEFEFPGQVDGVPPRSYQEVGTYTITVVADDIGPDGPVTLTEVVEIQVRAQDPELELAPDDGVKIGSDEWVLAAVNQLIEGDIVTLLVDGTSIDGEIEVINGRANFKSSIDDLMGRGKHTLTLKVTRGDETFSLEHTIKVKKNKEAKFTVSADDKVEVDLDEVKLKVKGGTGSAEVTVARADAAEKEFKGSKKPVLQVNADAGEGVDGVTLTVYYTDADLAAAGVDESDLSMFYLHEDMLGEEWIDLTSPTGVYPYEIWRAGSLVQTVFSAPLVDEDANSISVELAHLSTYQLAGSEPVAEPEPEPEKKKKSGGGGSKDVVEDVVDVVEEEVEQPLPEEPAVEEDEEESAPEFQDVGREDTTTGTSSTTTEGGATTSYIGWFALGAVICVGIFMLVRRNKVA